MYGAPYTDNVARVITCEQQLASAGQVSCAIHIAVFPPLHFWITRLWCSPRESEVSLGTCSCWSEQGGCWSCHPCSVLRVFRALKGCDIGIFSKADKSQWKFGCGLSTRRNFDTEPFSCPRWSWAPTVVVFLLSFLVKSLKCTFVCLLRFSVSACTFSLTAILQCVHCCLAAASTQGNVSFRCSMENPEIRYPCHPMADIRASVVGRFQQVLGLSTTHAAVLFAWTKMSLNSEKNEPEVCSKMHQNLLNSALEMCSRNAPEMCSKMHQLVGMLFSFFKQGWMARFIFAITKKQSAVINTPPPPPHPTPTNWNNNKKPTPPKNRKERRARWHCKGFCREQNIKKRSWVSLRYQTK